MKIEIRIGDDPGPAPRRTGPERLHRRTLLGLAMLFEGGMLALAWVLGMVLDLPLLSRLGPAPAQLVLGLAGTLPLLAALAWALRSRWGLMRRLKRGVDELVDRALLDARPGDLVLIALMAGVGEEALFRGILQPLLADVFGPWLGNAGAALAFGLAHPISAVYVAYASVVGFYLGALLELGDGLLAPVVTHAAYDLVALLWLVSRRRRHFRGAAAETQPPDGSGS